MATTPQVSFEKRVLDNGEINPKYIDVLAEDQPIVGQRFVSISFISPETILKNRDLYFFEQFIKQWDINEARKEMLDFVHYIAYNYTIDIDELLNQFNLFIKDTSTNVKKHEKTTIQEDYDTFLDFNRDALQKEFDTMNNFKTSVRGIKIRGVYPTEEIAQSKCKELMKIDPDNNITIGEVGKWLAWEPDLYKTGNVEYMEPELNQLYQEKIKNEANAKAHFEQRTMEMKKKAIEENMKKAESTNTVVTQTIDPETGVLKTLRDNIDFSSREVAPTPSRVK
jgi:hypothetical protein